MVSASNKGFSQERSRSSNLPENGYVLTDDEFQVLRTLIYKLIGINLGNNKRILIVSRLTKRLRFLGLVSFSDYLSYLKDSPEADYEIIQLINNITTNKTDFFRESHHIKYITDILYPSWVDRRLHDVRIWSAGCSSGEEPYSIAMAIDAAIAKYPRQGAGTNTNIRILATDVDTAVLEACRAAIYRIDLLEYIPNEYRLRYTSPLDAKTFRIVKPLQDFITFKRFNLMHDFPFKKGFNVILCRNVLIYFKREDRLRIVEKMHSVLREGGILMLGHSESLLAEQCGFKNLGETIYLKQ